MESEHTVHHGATEHTSARTNPKEESSPMLLSLSLILASLILSTSIYFSAQLLSQTIDAKSFSINVQPAAAPIINITIPASAIGAAAGTNAAQAAAKPATAPTPSAGGCGTGGSAAPTKATVDVTGRAVKGLATAKVTIVEFSDFQCPYCVRVQSTLAQLEKDYAGKINVVHINFIVHAGAKPAHVATECAGDQGKYWEMHDQIFATQKTDVASLRLMAQNLSLDMTKYDACILAGKDATLDAQKAIGSSIGVSGTPSFVIGVRSGNKVTGQVLVGAQDISAFKTAIDAQLKN